MTLKPCVACGEPSIESRCDEHRRENIRERSARSSRKAHGARWQRLSRRLRALQPWCDWCSATEHLHVDHIIPMSERPDLEFVVANLRILCASHNASRGDRVTDDERAEVERRLAARPGETPRPRPVLGSAGSREGKLK